MYVMYLESRTTRKETQAKWVYIICLGSYKFCWPRTYLSWPEVQCPVLFNNFSRRFGLGWKDGNTLRVNYFHDISKCSFLKINYVECLYFCKNEKGKAARPLTIAELLAGSTAIITHSSPHQLFFSSSVFKNQPLHISTWVTNQDLNICIFLQHQTSMLLEPS